MSSGSHWEARKGACVPAQPARPSWRHPRAAPRRAATHPLASTTTVFGICTQGEKQAEKHSIQYDN